MHVRQLAWSAAGLPLLLALAPTSGAQTTAPVRVLRLQVDNDAFDFWMPAWDRPDDEYTSGVDVSVQTEGAPWWSRRLLSSASACNTASAHCILRRDAIGQDLYTPERHVGDGGPRPGNRPNAAWLYYESAVRVVSEASRHEFAVVIGTTGPPALARQTQGFFHMLAARYNRPIDWSRQIPFSPGLILRYDWASRFGIGARSGAPRSVGAEIEPRFTVSAGNVITQAEAGARLRAGIALANPWIPSGPSSPFRLDVVAGASERAVAYNAFLDGTMFRGGPSVRRRPLVAEHELAAELSWRRLGLGYRAVTTGPEYRTRTAAHPWSSLIGEWRY